MDTTAGRKTSRSNLHYSAGGLLGVGAYQQGIEVTDIRMERASLPLMGRSDRYQLIYQYRDTDGKIVSGSLIKNEENNYYTDGDPLFRSKYTMTEDVKTNTAKIVFPDGGVVQAISYKVNTSMFGAGQEYRQDTPYHDLQKYDPIKWVGSDQSFGVDGMYPMIAKSPSYDTDDDLNGIIEPFAIRSLVYGKWLFLPSEPFPGSVTGEFAVNRNGSVFAYSHHVSERKTPRAFYEDVVSSGYSASLENQTAEKVAQQLLEPFYVSEASYQNDPYTDRSSWDYIWLDEEIEGVLKSMNGNMSEGSLPIEHVDATTGWVSTSKQNWDSLVYRDLLR